MNEKNDIYIAKEWFSFARNIDNMDNQKDIFEFIIYWIAFNRLYNSFSNKAFEWEKIREYIGDKYKSNPKYFKKLYNSTNNSDINILIKYPILNKGENICENIDYMNKRILNEREEWSLTIYQDYHKKNKSNDEEKSKDLFEMIYKVRCNLIHGGKEVDVERDRELIRASRNIMKSFLEQVAFK